MVRVITQDTFNELVKENIEELDMSPEEAVQEAVEQFEAQGVDLSNIIKEAMVDQIGDSENKITKSLEKLQKLLKKPDPKDEKFIKYLEILRSECDQTIAHKVFAGSKGAYNILITILEKFMTNNEIALAALRVLTSLMNGNPDLLDKRGIEVMITYLDNQQNEEIQKELLEWVKLCCIKHEQNRQDIFDMKILPRLKIMLHIDTSPELVRKICSVIRALVLDDDIRVEFGRAHEHARSLADEVLFTLTDLLQKFICDKDTVCDVIFALSSLIVRNEFCEKVEEAGGLTFIMDVFVQHADREKLNRLCLKLVKGLAGNDNVKAKICNQGMAPLITSAMHRHEASPGLVAEGCAAIAALSLRCPNNSKILCDAGAPEVILQGMKIHNLDATVQKQGSWAIRNIISRDKSLCSVFLNLGAEDILREALSVHVAKVDFDARAALRDLGVSDEDKKDIKCFQR